LRALGWWDFLKMGVPDTHDARIVAAHAADWLLLDADGRAHDFQPKVLYAILAFARAERGTDDLPSELEGRFMILLARPVSRETLREWFLLAFQ
jgi:hypothetical protein